MSDGGLGGGRSPADWGTAHENSMRGGPGWGASSGNDAWQGYRGAGRKPAIWKQIAAWCVYGCVALLVLAAVGKLFGLN